MKLRKVSILWHDETGSHTETYTEGAFTNAFPLGHPDPEQWARDLMDRFNSSPRPGELPRTVDDIVMIELSESMSSAIDLQHSWEKTNIITISDSYGVYDTARCRECGVTAKRFGLSNVYTRDPLYKGETFKFCNKAKAYIEKRRTAGDMRR